ncbi:MAG: hypothetical protein JXR86_17890 [Spirochaetales bacterium]|nr:hypothetical protein [Spirochaetales bacterium]
MFINSAPAPKTLNESILSREMAPSFRLKDILLPFSSNKKGTKNMGLGLTMSYGIINKYNGDISYRNLEDQGCEFTITLPVRRGK